MCRIQSSCTDIGPWNSTSQNLRRTNHYCVVLQYYLLQYCVLQYSLF